MRTSALNMLLSGASGAQPGRFRRALRPGARTCEPLRWALLDRSGGAQRSSTRGSKRNALPRCVCGPCEPRRRQRAGGGAAQPAAGQRGAVRLPLARAKPAGAPAGGGAVAQPHRPALARGVFAPPQRRVVCVWQRAGSPAEVVEATCRVPPAVVLLPACCVQHLRALKALKHVLAGLSTKRFVVDAPRPQPQQQQQAPMGLAGLPLMHMGAWAPGRGGGHRDVAASRPLSRTALWRPLSAWGTAAAAPRLGAPAGLCVQSVASVALSVCARPPGRRPARGGGGHRPGAPALRHQALSGGRAPHAALPGPLPGARALVAPGARAEHHSAKRQGHCALLNASPRPPRHAHAAAPRPPALQLFLSLAAQWAHHAAAAKAAATCLAELLQVAPQGEPARVFVPGSVWPRRSAIRQPLGSRQHFRHHPWRSRRGVANAVCLPEAGEKLPDRAEELLRACHSACAAIMAGPPQGTQRVCPSFLQPRVRASRTAKTGAEKKRSALAA